MMFRELTQEEMNKIETFQRLKGQISDLELRRLEKRKEIEFYEQHRGMDYVPAIVWGLLFLSQLVLIFCDIYFNWFDTRFSIAIMFAAMTPALAVFFGFFFFKSLWEYILKNSKNPRHMKKAMDKGLENRWMRSAKIRHEMDEINAELRVIKKNYGYLKLEVEQIQQSQYSS